jgi:nucleotide-binding universal stress UspA family protein
VTATPRKVLVVLEPGAARHASLAVAAEAALADGGTPPGELVLLACGVEAELPPSWTGPALLREYAALMRRRREADLEDLAAPLRRAGLAVTVVDACCLDVAATLRQQLARIQPDLVVKDTRADGLARWHLLTDQVLLQPLPCTVLLVPAGPDGHRLPGAPARFEPAGSVSGAAVSGVPASSAPAAPAMRRASSP